jgi:hypothetical protein
MKEEVRRRRGGERRRGEDKCSLRMYSITSELA